MDPMGASADLSRTTWRKSSFSSGSNSACVEVTRVQVWRKSSFSNGQGGNCVEVGDMPAWRKSSFSNGSGGECVEARDSGRAIAVRDSKDPDGSSLLVSPGAWADFTGRVKSDWLAPARRGA